MDLSSDAVCECQAVYNQAYAIHDETSFADGTRHKLNNGGCLKIRGRAVKLLTFYWEYVRKYLSQENFLPLFKIVMHSCIFALH